MLANACKPSEGYEKISKHFQLAVFTVQSFIRKWQLRETVEVKARSSHQENTLKDLLICWPERQSKTKHNKKKVKIKLIAHNHKSYVVK